MMTRTESIAELAKAFAMAQAEFKPAKRNSDNPYFKSKYADLTEILSAVLPALNKNGLSILQFPDTEGKRVTVETMLLHSSGQSISNSLTIMAKSEDAQSVGSAITYCKRYGLSAVVGISAEDDDDGNGATYGYGGNPAPKRQTRPAPAPAKPRQEDSWFGVDGDSQIPAAPPVPPAEAPKQMYTCEGCGRANVTEKVKNWSIEHHEGKVLCMTCQNKLKGK